MSVASISKFHVLSNCALVFAINININIIFRKMDKTIHGNCACIKPTFSAASTQLTGKPSPSLERA
jgi:hypothetical protein